MHMAQGFCPWSPWPQPLHEALLKERRQVHLHAFALKAEVMIT
jgi:hypothetical protein